jgi:hypothetical protein
MAFIKKMKAQKAAAEVKPVGPDLENYKKPAGPAVDSSKMSQKERDYEERELRREEENEFDRDDDARVERMHEYLAKRKARTKAADDNIRSAVAMVNRLDDLRAKIAEAKSNGDRAKLSKLQEQFKVLYKQQGKLMKKQKSYDGSRRARLHRALDSVLDENTIVYGKRPVIRKTLSILDPADLLKMTGVPGGIGKGKPFTRFAKDASCGPNTVCANCNQPRDEHYENGECPPENGMRRQRTRFKAKAKDENPRGIFLSNLGNVGTRGIPREKARLKLSPDQAAYFKALLAQVKPAPSAAAPTPRAKDSDEGVALRNELRELVAKQRAGSNKLDGRIAVIQSRLAKLGE